MSYTTVKGKSGIRYMKDNKFIKKDSIPADILIKLDVGMKAIEPETEPQVTKCIFCDMATKRYRLINQQAIYVCENDYYDYTVGQIVQQLRKKGKEYDISSERTIVQN